MRQIRVKRTAHPQTSSPCPEHHGNADTMWEVYRARQLRAMKSRGPSAKRSWIMFLARCQRGGRVVRRSASPSRASAGSYFQRSRGLVRDTEDGCRTDPASTGDHWVSPAVHQEVATPAREKEPAI